MTTEEEEQESAQSTERYLVRNFTLDKLVVHTFTPLTKPLLCRYTHKMNIDGKGCNINYPDTLKIMCAG